MKGMTSNREEAPGVRHRGWLVLPVLVAPLPNQEAMEEYQALSKVLKLFLSLVTWPGQEERPLRVAVIGGTAFGTDLDVNLGRGTVGGRKVVIQYFSGPSFLADSHSFDAVFLDRGEETRLPAILEKTAGKPVLTMGYGQDPTRRGVMVNFFLENAAIRFEVNPNRIKEANLTISSHLLKIAKIVEK